MTQVMETHWKEALMSQAHDTLTDQLRQRLREIKEGKQGQDWLRGLLEWLLQELLEVEFAEFLGAEPYERSEARRGYRNGYRERGLITRVGRLTLRVPRDRQGRFSSELFERYQRSEKALVLALQESYLQGVSTRKVRRITEQLCGVEFSKDQVSKAAQALDEELERWRNRPLEKAYPYLIADARYEYVREDGRVESEGVLTIKGIDGHGYREILSVRVAPVEEEASWNEAFGDLLSRGLDVSSVCCITSDEHRGLRAAIRRYLPKAAWQRCQTHYQRNAASKVPRKARREVHAGLRDVFDAPHGELAQQRAQRLMEAWRQRFPELVAWMEETIDQPLTVFSLPTEHRKRMRTTNGLERYNQEARRRSRVVRIFPNRASCLRLSSALAMEQSEEWLTGHRYLNMQALEEAKPETTDVLLRAPVGVAL
jgi:transposase-like protein